MEQAIERGPPQHIRTGQFKGIARAARESGIKLTTLAGRIKSGKTLEEAVAMGQPREVKRKVKDYWSVASRVRRNPKTILGWVYRGWPLDKIEKMYLAVDRIKKEGGKPGRREEYGVTWK